MGNNLFTNNSKNWPCKRPFKFNVRQQCISTQTIKAKFHAKRTLKNGWNFTLSILEQSVFSLQLLNEFRLYGCLGFLFELWLERLLLLQLLLLHFHDVASFHAQASLKQKKKLFPNQKIKLLKFSSKTTIKKTCFYASEFNNQSIYLVAKKLKIRAQTLQFKIKNHQFQS